MITWSYTLLSDSGPGGGTSSPTGGGSFTGLSTPELAYAELALDPVTGDLPAQPYIARGPDAVVQRVRVRFRFWRGEWFLDLRLGIPYRESVLVKAPDLILIAAIFRQVLTSTPGVAKVVKFSAVLDRPTRELLCDFEATLDDGAVLRAEAEPFIVG